MTMKNGRENENWITFCFIAVKFQFQYEFQSENNNQPEILIVHFYCYYFRCFYVLRARRIL